MALLAQFLFVIFHSVTSQLALVNVLIQCFDRKCRLRKSHLKQNREMTLIG